MRSELSILEEFGESLAPAQDHPPVEVRHRVMNGMRHRARRPRLLSRLGGVRLAWRIGGSVVVAAGVAAALVSAQLAGVGSGQPAPPGRGMAAGPSAAEPSADAVPQELPTAGQVMLLAARHVAATPTMDVSADQFLFIDSVEVSMRSRNGRNTDTGPLRTRTWLSVDGTRDGLVLQEAAPSSRRSVRTNLDGCTNGRQAETIDRPESTPQVACTPEPAYRPGSVPTDADRLLAHVRARAVAEPEWVSVDTAADRLPRGYLKLSAEQTAFNYLADILYRNHLPAVQEAAFRAAGRIAGVQVRRDATDAAGRHGIAVTRTEGGKRAELLFDPTTYRYLGHNIIGAKLDLRGTKVVRETDGKGSTELFVGAAPKPGEVIYKFALLRIAIVDRSGRRP